MLSMSWNHQRATDIGADTLTWYAASEGPLNIQGVVVDESTREIADNLARAAMMKKVKSSLDLRLRVTAGRFCRISLFSCDR